MPKPHVIAVLEGDGIGPEIVAEALKVLGALESVLYNGEKRFEIRRVPFGASAWFEYGTVLPEETLKACDEADAIVKGPIGLSFEESRRIPVDEQPERAGLLVLRKRYATFANFRPVYLPPELSRFSPLKPAIVGDGVDIMIIRELVGGLYFGSKEEGVDVDGKRWVKESLEYDEDAIRRILIVAFEEARRRRKVVHNVHKSNVLMSSVLWNAISEEVADDYPDVTMKHIIVDAAATAMVLNPRQFDVMVMENMFGDILSDLGGGLLGSLGLMPSASLGLQKALYEPSHGSAPDIAGQGIANPYSMIGSFAMMLEKSFDLPREAAMIWEALRSVYAEGFATPDLAGPDGQEGLQPVSTSEFGDRAARHAARAAAQQSFA